MIRGLLYKLHRWVWDYRPHDESVKISTATTGINRLVGHDDIDPTIRFSVTTARGGVIVASRTYDRQKDRSNDIIHVIHDDEDVARRVGEIVALELMKA